MYRTRRFIFALLLLALLIPTTTPAHADGGEAGDATIVEDANPPSQLASTVNGMIMGFAQENGKTTIRLRVCSDAPNFQLRSEEIGQWITEVFYRTQKVNGCSPSPTSWWKMVINADPNTGEVFRIYGTANDGILSEAEFMRRAARTDCRVTSYGGGICTPATPGAVSATSGSLDEPVAQVQGIVTVRGWAADAGAWSGTGVDALEVLVNNRLIGEASYGGARPDVAAALGDSRFTHSGFSYSLNTTQFTNGAATLTVRYRSAIRDMEMFKHPGIMSC